MIDSLAYALRDPRARDWGPSSYSVAGRYSWLERRAWSGRAAGRAVRDVVRVRSVLGEGPSTYCYAAAHFANGGASILPLLMDDAEEGSRWSDPGTQKRGIARFQTDCARLRGEASGCTRGKCAPGVWTTDSLAYALKDPRSRDWGPSSHSVAERCF